VLDVVSIPVVAHGGPGKNQHVLDLVNKLPVSGVAISSLFHYDCIKNKIFSNNYEGEGNVDFLCSNRILTNIESSSIGELRAFLLSKNIYCREYEK